MEESEASEATDLEAKEEAITIKTSTPCCTHDETTKECETSENCNTHDTFKDCETENVINKCKSSVVDCDTKETIEESGDTLKTGNVQINNTVQIKGECETIQVKVELFEPLVDEGKTCFRLNLIEYADNLTPIIFGPRSVSCLVITNSSHQSERNTCAKVINY